MCREISWRRLSRRPSRNNRTNAAACWQACGKKRAPAEAVGRVLRRYPLVNVLASPREFLSDARSMFDADRDMRAWGLDLLAVYHSHPTSPAIPSRTDLERHGMEEVVCMIVSLAGSPPEVRAWRLMETEYREADWEIMDNGTRRQEPPRTRAS